MPQRNLVLFDLEWNIGYQPYTFNYHGVQQTFRGEIIEIGAVKIDEDANVLDTFSIHLRPRIFRKLQHHIAKVTGLTQADLDRGEPIVQILKPQFGVLGLVAGRLGKDVRDLNVAVLLGLGGIVAILGVCLGLTGKSGLEVLLGLGALKIHRCTSLQRMPPVGFERPCL